MAKKKAKKKLRQKKGKEETLLEAIERLKDEGESLVVICEIMSLAYRNEVSKEATKAIRTMMISIVENLNEAAKEVGIPSSI